MRRRPAADRRGARCCRRLDQLRLRARGRRSSRANARGDADLGRVLVLGPVGVLPPLRRHARPRAQTYAGMKNYLDDVAAAVVRRRRRRRSPTRSRPASATGTRRPARRPGRRADARAAIPTIIAAVRRPPTSPTWRRSPPTRRARSASRPTRPSSTRCSRRSRRTSTPSGGTRASATTARTPAQILAQTIAGRWRWRSGSCPTERRRGLQEKLVNDVLVTRAGHRWSASPARAGSTRCSRRPPARACRTRPRRRTRSRSQTTYPSLRLLGRARLDVAGRVLGGLEPHPQPPHVRHDRAVVLRGPGGHQAAQAGLRARSRSGR